MTKIQDCTSIEQGLMLVNAGIDTKTADKCWIGIGAGDDVTHVSLSFEQAKANKMSADKFLVDIAEKQHPQAMTPSWSLTALLLIINERYYTSLFHDGVAWNVRATDHNNKDITESAWADSPIDACVKLALLLQERKDI